MLHGSWRRSRRDPGRAAVRLGLGLALLLSLGLTACTQDDPEPGPSPSASTSPPSSENPATLRLAIYGNEDELAVYDSFVRGFDAARPEVEVILDTYRDHTEAIRAYRAGGRFPDVFMVSRSDLAWLREQERLQPVDQLLDERGVNFSATYARDTLEAFASDNGLSCLPYAVSPTLLYVNRELVDFEQMALRGLDVPDDPVRWSWEEFEAAVRFAARPRRNTWGIYLEPTLAQLSPFVYAAGGDLFDDQQAPTTMTFSDGDTLAALEQILPLFRNQRLMPTPDEVLDRTPVELFEAGEVGMIVGSRELTPRFRENVDVDFDVMPIPSIARTQTTGEVSGICLSAEARDLDLAADLLMTAFSTESISRISHLGYLVPANVEVAQSDRFLQPGRQPLNSAAFNRGVRDLVVFPAEVDATALDKAVGDDVRALLEQPVIDLETLAGLIDEHSLEVLAPETETESPSATP